MAQDFSWIENEKWYAIAHVCRHWRLVALDTGVLWSNIICDHTLSFEKIKAQLSHSRNADLSCTIKHYSSLPSNFEETLHAISAHKERITTMNIKILDKLWVDFSRLFDPFPSRLNTLKVNILPDRNVFLPNLRTLSLEDILAPKDLRVLRLDGCVLRAISLNELQPLRSLVDLTFDDVDFEWHHLRRVLRLCPNLKNMAIVRGVQFDNAELSDDNPLESSSHLEHPFLQNLKIHRLSTSQAYRLFKHCNLPVSSNWDLRCLTPLTFGYESSDDSWDLQKTMIISLFSRHSHYDMLHITLNDDGILFRTDSTMGEVGDGGMAVTTKVLFDNEHSILGITDDQYCEFLIQLIRSTGWRNVKDFRFYVQPRYCKITNARWVDILSSFDNLTALEVMLPLQSRRTRTQMELSAALRYAADHDIFNSTLESLSLIVIKYDGDYFEAVDGDFFDGVKYFLNSARYEDTKISKLSVEYLMKSEDTFYDLEDLEESLSGYAQELRVEMYRS